MGTVEYKTDLHETYAIADIPQDADPGQYGLLMLEKNRIRGVLPSRQRTEEGRNRLYFDITGKRSLQQEFADKEMELEDMAELIRQILEVLEEIRKYLLTEKTAVFLPQYMYRGMEDGQLYLMLFPWKQEKLRLQELAEFFLEKISHRDEHGVNAAYHFYKQQKEPFFSFSVFLPVIERERVLKQRKLQETSEREEKGKCLEEIQITAEADVDPSKPEEEKKRTPTPGYGIVSLLFGAGLLAATMLVPMDRMQTMLCRIGAGGLLLFAFLSMITAWKRGAADRKEESETMLRDEGWEESVSAYDETVFFDHTEEFWKLQYREKGAAKEYILRDFPVTIGKLEGEIVLKDSSVSRIHCRIEEKGEKKYIRDINSTNGTFLNGLKLHSGEIMEIEKNDEIRVGKVVLLVV